MVRPSVGIDVIETCATIGSMSRHRRWGRAATPALSAVLVLCAVVVGVGSGAASALAPPIVVVMMETREDTQLTSSNAPHTSRA